MWRFRFCGVSSFWAWSCRLSFIFWFELAPTPPHHVHTTCQQNRTLCFCVILHQTYFRTVAIFTDLSAQLGEIKRHLKNAVRTSSENQTLDTYMIFKMKLKDWVSRLRAVYQFFESKQDIHLPSHHRCHEKRNFGEKKKLTSESQR